MLTLEEFIQVCRDVNSDLQVYARTEGPEFVSRLIERLDTFEDIEHAMTFALAGFSATRFADIYYCDECSIYAKLEPDFDLKLAHKYLSRNCPIVQNVKINDEIINNDIDMLLSCIIK